MNITNNEELVLDKIKGQETYKTLMKKTNLNKTSLFFALDSLHRKGLISKEVLKQKGGPLGIELTTSGTKLSGVLTEVSK